MYMAQKLKYPIPSIINNYLNDFLIIPIVLILSLYVLRWSKNNNNYKISIGLIVYICGFYALLFECILPKYYVRYTADVIDVLLYFLSGIIFYYLQKKSYE